MNPLDQTATVRHLLPSSEKLFLYHSLLKPQITVYDLTGLSRPTSLQRKKDSNYHRIAVGLQSLIRMMLTSNLNTLKGMNLFAQRCQKQALPSFNDLIVSSDIMIPATRNITLRHFINMLMVLCTAIH